MLQEAWGRWYEENEETQKIEKESEFKKSTRETRKAAGITGNRLEMLLLLYGERSK
jgi:hypothetical protein